ncbi:hypothetical protein HZB88_03285 [archaeon]|nr:hypothetical protein [archaeon]
MKIIRNIGKIIGSSVFVLALTTAALMIGLTKFTEYDNLKGVVIGLIDKQVGGSIDETMLTQMHQMFLEECKKNDKIQLSEVMGQNITLDCSDVNKSAPEGLMGLIENAMFDNIYYKKYDCSFIECLQKPDQEKFSVIISSEAHSFFTGLQNFLFLISGVGLVMMLVSIETWWNRLKAAGVSLLSIALPFFVLILLKDRILPVSGDVKTAVAPIIDQLFGSMSDIFLVMLIAGVVLTAGGYILHDYRKGEIKRK